MWPEPVPVGRSCLTGGFGTSKFPLHFSKGSGRGARGGQKARCGTEEAAEQPSVSTKHWKAGCVPKG